MPINRAPRGVTTSGNVRKGVAGSDEAGEQLVGEEPATERQAHAVSRAVFHEPVLGGPGERLDPAERGVARDAPGQGEARGTASRPRLRPVHRLRATRCSVGAAPANAGTSAALHASRRAPFHAASRRSNECDPGPTAA